ncbi:MAG TPA: protein translocase subunit SecD [Beijerinckiaceae bacterium]|jgi:preprotein translocase subunit SecD
MLRFSTPKTLAIIAVILYGCLLAAPNLLSREQRQALQRSVPSWVPSWVLPTQAVTLGLDLQGGSHVLLEVDRADLVRGLVTQLRDDARRVLRETRIGIQGGLQTNPRGVQLRVTDPSSQGTLAAKLRELSQPIANPVLGQTAARDIAVTEGSDGQIQVAYTEEGVTARIQRATEQALEVVRRRIDILGTTEPNIQRQGVGRILVQVPGLQDPQRLKEILGKTAKLEFRLLADNEGSETELLPSRDSGGQRVPVERRIVVSGEDLTDAQPGFDQRTNEPIVNFRFNVRGAQRFGQATTENVNRALAIVLDNEVISAPRILQPITQGSGQISGRFTVEQANNLSVLLRAGALPAKLNIVEERTVGPSLGADSIRAGAVAGVVACLLVAAFMLAVYGLFGFFALIALAANVTLLFGIQSALGATLTLPGIAGIILTIGMAVDSNVVIFERIRDEARLGQSPIVAIDKGFSFALGTIMDANATAFFTALVLLLFGGSGPVRGFAVTFIIGILTTAFTAFTLTRLVIATWVRSRRPAAIPI